MSSLVLYFVLRLKMSFEGSIFAISMQTLLIYYISLFISMVFMFAAFIIVGIWPFEYRYFILLMSISIVIVMLLALHITWLFNKKLFKLILTRSQSPIARGKTRDLSPNDLNIIDATTKQSLIQTIGISAFLCSLIVSGLLILMTIEIEMVSIDEDEDVANSDVTAAGLIEFLYTLIPSLIILSILMFLIFQPMTNWYDCCCGKCHVWMKGCCVGLVKKEMLKNQKQEDEEKRQIVLQQHQRTESYSLSMCNSQKDDL